MKPISEHERKQDIAIANRIADFLLRRPEEYFTYSEILKNFPEAETTTRLRTRIVPYFRNSFQTTGRNGKIGGVLKTVPRLGTKSTMDEKFLKKHMQYAEARARQAEKEVAANKLAYRALRKFRSDFEAAKA